LDSGFWIAPFCIGLGCWRAKARRDASHLEHALRRLEEHVGGVGEWPKWLLALASKERLVTTDRFSLCAVLLGNRVPPILVAEHVVQRLADKRACDDVRELFVKIATGNARRYTYWDVMEKKLVLLESVKCSASRERVMADEHWGPAIRLLQHRESMLHTSSSLTEAQRMRCEVNRLAAIARRNVRRANGAIAARMRASRCSRRRVPECAQSALARPWDSCVIQSIRVIA
jgi:hypothetical protein